MFSSFRRLSPEPYPPPETEGAAEQNTALPLKEAEPDRVPGLTEFLFAFDQALRGSEN